MWCRRASSCQLETIDGTAFENLKLVVELDFSWNRLQFVPLAEISRMSLLRKLSMRGNPLKSLTESTFTSSSSSADKETLTTSDDETSNLVDQSNSNSNANANNNNNMMARLYETYPILAKSLLLSFKRSLSQQQPLSSSGSSTINGEDSSFIIEQMELELLESIVRQHETSSDAPVEELDDNLGGGGEGEEEGEGNNDDGIGPADSLARTANELNQVSFASAASSLRSTERRRRRRSLVFESGGGLGSHFNQLQELDFGQCQLTYIKWSVFDQLDQLKRLHLDGNQLRLVERSHECSPHSLSLSLFRH